MVDILDPKEGETVYDPACGTGGMLLAAVEHVRERGGDPRTFFGKLHGQEKNLTTAAVARMNLFLHGIEDFVIERGDTLRNPVFTDASTGGLATFDVVIANPPFSLEQWGREMWETDPWGRASLALPTDSNGDMAWVQHMVKSMAARTGRMAVVLPQGALFRGGVEAQIRKHLLEQRICRGGHRPRPRTSSTAPASPPASSCLRQKKAKARKGKVLIVDADLVFRRGARRTSWSPNTAQILAWVRERSPTSRTAPASSTRRDREGGLDAQHLALRLPPIGADIPPLPEAVAAFKERWRSAARPRTTCALLIRRGWLSMSERLTQQELESYLWGAAVILRGLVDAGDYKQFVFPLLFFKRLSDVWDEDYAAALAESKGDADYATCDGQRPLRHPGGCALEGRARRREGRRQEAAERAARHRGRQPRPPRRHLRRRAVDQQGAPARRHAEEPARALLGAHALARQRARGRTRQRLRVPDQEVRRRQRPHGAGVLHQPHRGPPDGADARAQVRREHLRPDLRHGRHAHLGAGRGEAQAAASTARSSCSGKSATT
jgi:hypothetical protein